MSFFSLEDMSNSITAIKSGCSCLTGKVNEVHANRSILSKVEEVFNRTIQIFCRWLFSKKWVVSSYFVASLIGETSEAVKSGIRRLRKWQTTLKKHEVINAQDEASLALLKDKLNGKRPVLLLHGVHATPHTFIPWAKQLGDAYKAGDIGPLITLQLPDDMECRMALLYDTIDKICGIIGGDNPQVDIIGHSKGGYAAHLAKTKKDKLTIKDRFGVERRWHSIDKGSENKKVRKVISVAAPTWMCCQSKKTVICESIYPKGIFAAEHVDLIYERLQLTDIRENHKNYYDFVAVDDAISPVVSPLPNEQVFRFKHKHLSIISCSKVCWQAIKLLTNSIS